MIRYGTEHRIENRLNSPVQVRGMISSQIQPGFSPWAQFAKANISSVPSEPGVYVMRQQDGVAFGRFRGKSDIVYIGSTDNLRRRFEQYLRRPGKTQWTNIRVNAFLRHHRVDISWIREKNFKALEHNLLRQYLGDHEEFPPLNRADVRKLEI